MAKHCVPQYGCYNPQWPSSRLRNIDVFRTILILRNAKMSDVTTWHQNGDVMLTFQNAHQLREDSIFLTTCAVHLEINDHLCSCQHQWKHWILIASCLWFYCEESLPPKNITYKFFKSANTAIRNFLICYTLRQNAIYFLRENCVFVALLQGQGIFLTRNQETKENWFALPFINVILQRNINSRKDPEVFLRENILHFVLECKEYHKYVNFWFCALSKPLPCKNIGHIESLLLPYQQ